VTWLGVCAPEKFDALRFDMRRDFFELKRYVVHHGAMRTARLLATPTCEKTVEHRHF
jgi:hypothetical protein